MTLIALDPSMHAVVKQEPRPGCRLARVDRPGLRRSEVLVEVRAASICGTDIHIWDWDEWARQRVKGLPLVLGHECAGEVVEVGSDVTTVQEGDMVSLETHIADGTCYQCRTGRRHLCSSGQVLGLDRDGVFSEYVTVPEGNAWRNDPTLDPIIASLQEPLGNAVQSALPEGCEQDIAGSSVAVLGCGPIGLMSIAVAKALGAAQVFATELSANHARQALALTMGADRVFPVGPVSEDPVQGILAATGGRGVDVVFEMSGASSAFAQAFEVLSPGGRASLLGVHNKPVELDVNRAVIFKGARVYGIFGRRLYATWYQVKGLLANAGFREKLSRLVTHRFPFRYIADAMEAARSGQAGKVALIPVWA